MRRIIYLFIVRVFLYMLGIISYYATIYVRVFRAYGLAAGGIILCQPSADRSLCGGSSLAGASRKASPERGGARRRRAEGFVPQRWLVAAALSAAVTFAPKQGNAPNFHGRASSEQESSLFPAALRVGARGRGKTAIAASGG